jgi:hypothetical protein
MTRDQKMQAVVDAARVVANEYASRGGASTFAQDQLCAAFNDLDAHTEAEAETVTLEAWSHRDGDVVLVLPGSPLAREFPGNNYRQYRGTVTLPITREGGR